MCLVVVDILFIYIFLNAFYIRHLKYILKRPIEKWIADSKMTQLKVKKFTEWVFQVFICYLSVIYPLAFVICAPPRSDGGMVKLRGEVGPWGLVSGFSAASTAACRQRSLEAVGNRNTMASSLSLTQVTLSYNSNITTANAFCPLPVTLGDVSAASVKSGWKNRGLSLILVPLLEV